GRRLLERARCALQGSVLVESRGRRRDRFLAYRKLLGPPPTWTLPAVAAASARVPYANLLRALKAPAGCPRSASSGGLTSAALREASIGALHGRVSREG